uniref:zinc-binding metallopeptidase family protein n=1 Tax=Pseudonocardia sp. CA-107938 TaxID=3240021 RepID=UPI003D8A9FA4
MRSFACPQCASLVFFENTVCLTCGTELGYSRAERTLVRATGRQRCANAQLAECSWLLDGETAGGLCSCCALTRTRPSDTDVKGLAEFAATEAAKRRLLYQLDDLGLPVVGRDIDPDGGLAFDLLSSTDGPVVTGHASGVVTLDLAEGDDGHRERMRVELAEPYRTLLGHLRHETGHWYWEVLVDRPGRHAEFRELFGDERADYADALSRHYSSAPPEGWADRYVSTYATAHPWEDWAETFAHYLHIRDTSQTAAAYGVIVTGPAAKVHADLRAVPSTAPEDFGQIIDTWLPLTYALNAVNRSMGFGDLYPFVLAPAVLDKLRYVHDLVVAHPAYVAAAAVNSRNGTR